MILDMDNKVLLDLANNFIASGNTNPMDTRPFFLYQLK